MTEGRSKKTRERNNREPGTAGAPTSPGSPPGRRPAILSVILAGLGLLVPLVLFFYPPSSYTKFFYGLFRTSVSAGEWLQVAAIVLGFASRWMLKRSRAKRRDRRWARAGIIMGFCFLIALIALERIKYFDIVLGVADTKSDFRQLEVHLESYYIDHNTYPPAVDENGKIIPYEPGGASVSAGYLPWLLTTPVAYADLLPRDPCYHPRWSKAPLYRYATNGKDCWILTGPGTDRIPEIPIEEYPSPGMGSCQFKKFMSQFGGPAIQYDGTNGLISTGDILRVGP